MARAESQVDVRDEVEFGGISVDADIDPIFSSRAVIENTKVAPINGGINPEFFGYHISGSVELGSNFCHARGRVAELKTFTSDGVLYIIPVLNLKSQDSEPRVCDAMFAPVSGDVILDVLYSRKEIQKIVILNADEQGRVYSFEP
jgi:hypothetical protein